MSAVPNLPASLQRLAASSGHLAQPLQSNGDTPLTSTFQLHDNPVDSFRRLRVVVVGAGYSGIYLAIRIPQRLRNVELAVYEKNQGLGGTWFENRYPGCACDIPSHSYQYTFNPNPSWSALYAPAAEIQEYLAGTAKKYGADRFVKLSHRVDNCSWDDPSGKWRISVTNLESGDSFEDTADVLINARGGLNEPKWPDTIPGWGQFKGEVMHSARWNEGYDFENKRIAVIGSGSSSIQIVPSLQRVSGAQLAVFVRNRTWISPPFGQTLWDRIGMEGTSFSETQKAAFAADPVLYQSFRLKVEEEGNGIHTFTQRGTPTQAGARKLFADSMRKRLAAKPEILDALLPTFSPGCRRLTPGPGYLEALTQENVEFVTVGIVGVEPRGIRTEDGRLHEIDVLVCATGFQAGAPPPFPVLGRGGRTMEEHWAKHPRTYLGLTTDGFPNYFIMLGPNSAIGTGSLTTMIEKTADYIIRCARKVQKENLKSMEVESEMVEDFLEVAQKYFERTVFTEDCRSWYKNASGQVTGLWPGSMQHCIEVLRSPRWEDFRYENHRTQMGDRRENKLGWLGNGWTKNQMENKHLAWYLYPEFVDIPESPRPEEAELYEKVPFSY